MNVEQLAAVEEKWLNMQRGLGGDRETLYERDGVYAAWRDMFGQYVALAREGDLEAFKRALFFVWAQCAMSHLVTGIKDLNEESVREVLDIADKLAQDDRLDAELKWMLSCYYLVEPLYLDCFGDLDALKEASRVNPLEYRQRCLEVSFDHRGQLGAYWRTEQAHLRRWG